MDYSGHFKLLSSVAKDDCNYDNHSFEELCVHMKNILFMVNFIFIRDNL